MTDETQFGEYTFSADKQKLDLDFVYNVLCKPSIYSAGLPAERFPIVLEHSVCFGVYQGTKQVGFARVITDFSEFASLWDVFIDKNYRGKSLGKRLMKTITEHPRLRGIYRWFLMTEDAHELYKKFGFKSEAYNPYVMMRVASAD